MKKRMLSLIGLGIACLVVFSFLYYQKHPLSAKLTINGKTFYVDVAVTPEEKEKGLGYRSSMPMDRGMIFLYDHKDYYKFWMKGMQFPLDFIWIDGNKIVDITQHVPISTNGTLPIYKPTQLVDKILEVNAGVINQNGIHIGDTIVFMK